REIFSIGGIANPPEYQLVDPDHVVLIYGFPVDVDRSIGFGEVIRIGTFDDAKLRQLHHGARSTQPGLLSGGMERGRVTHSRYGGALHVSCHRGSSTPPRGI